MNPTKSVLTKAHRASFIKQRARSPHPWFIQQRCIHASRHLYIIKPFLLADIGEGITECQLIQWFVQPGARVQQFDKLCEVQSDKASVEITSPFDGVIKKLHYDPDDMAITGKPLVDIDIQSEISEADAEKLGDTKDGGREDSHIGKERLDEVKTIYGMSPNESGGEGVVEPTSRANSDQQESPDLSRLGKNDKRALATPAVRHLTKELNVNILDIRGTGKDGRVMKEDVHRYVQRRDQQHTSSDTVLSLDVNSPRSPREDRKVSLTPVQNQMFKVMTRSLQIPHFLYTCSADMSAITTLRTRVNATAASPEKKLTHLAFIIKAVSMALQYHPLINAALDTKDPKKPELIYKGTHNFGVAIDTPSGLLVPVVKSIQDLSIAQIALKLRELSLKARESKLLPTDFSGATFTVSNIGSVGGGVVAPVISEPQVAILGVGRSKIVPAFNTKGELVKKEELVLSWSADHRVVDGAECARCAERVKELLEQPERMMVDMR